MMASGSLNKHSDETIVVEGVEVPRWLAERLPLLDFGRREFILGNLRLRQEQPERWLSRDEVNGLIS